MKKNYLLTLVIMLCSLCFLNAQSYYYYKGQKQNLTLDKSALRIFVDNNLQTSSISSNNIKPYSLSVSTTTEKFANIEFVNIPTDAEYYAKINELKANDNLNSVVPKFTSAEGNTLFLTKYLFIKLKNASDLNVLQGYATSKNFTIVGPNQFMSLWYKLKVNKNTLGNSLEISNFLFETGNFASTDSAFSSDYVDDVETNNTQALIPNNNPQNPSSTVCTNDTNFTDLWGLENSLNPNIDIDICNAWTITEGAGVKVAVLDSGIDLNNLDLNSNILPLSYDTVTDNSPSQVYHPHATQVAGVIGAIKNNNYQVVGVAPQSKLFSISSKLDNSDILDVEKRANGINWAWQNGAHVINNSWYSYYQSNFINNAISDAFSLGRNGLIC